MDSMSIFDAALKEKDSLFTVMLEKKKKLLEKKENAFAATLMEKEKGFEDMLEEKELTLKEKAEMELKYVRQQLYLQNGYD